jgi:hypothetical protein
VLTVGRDGETLTASLNYYNPDKFFTVESCPGHGCHVFIEQSEVHNNPIINGIEKEEKHGVRKLPQYAGIKLFNILLQKDVISINNIHFPQLYYFQLPYVPRY